MAKQFYDTGIFCKINIKYLCTLLICYFKAGQLYNFSN